MDSAKSAGRVDVDDVGDGVDDDDHQGYQDGGEDDDVVDYLGSYDVAPHAATAPFIAIVSLPVDITKKVTTLIVVLIMSKSMSAINANMG